MVFNFFRRNKNENTPPGIQNNEGDFWGISVDGLKQVVSNTTKSLVNNIVEHFSTEEEPDEFFLDDMEDLLIKSDLGVGVASEIVDKLRSKNEFRPSKIKEFLKEEFLNILNKCPDNELNFEAEKLNIYFITGVNGAGKTTLIGKLASKFKKSGQKVLIAAGDTFRAAAEEQLDIWSKRAGADIVRKDGADPASVVFDAIKKAEDEHYNVLLIDTAGRLQNKFNLMQELAKIKAVIDKNAPESLRECMLVLDANTGQNGLSQAKVFSESVNLTSVALTKLDGSAKGGVIINIVKELNLPVKLIGVGEKLEDLKLFDNQNFIKALFA